MSNNPTDPGNIEQEVQTPDSSSAHSDTPGVVSKEVRNWAMIAHLSPLLGLLGIPFLNLLAPLLVWMFKKELHPFVEEQAREALNFQITMCIAGVLCFILVFVLIGFLLLPLLVLFDIVMCIVAAMKASNGTGYRYPMTLRFVN